MTYADVALPGATIPGITRNEALRALGNGVVPQQAEAALRFLLAHLTAEASA